LFQINFFITFSYKFWIGSILINHLSRKLSFLHLFFSSFLLKNTDNAGFRVKATTKEQSKVTVIIKGIENINLPIIQVIKSIAENIQTTVRVVEITTLL